MTITGSLTTQCLKLLESLKQGMMVQTLPYYTGVDPKQFSEEKEH